MLVKQCHNHPQNLPVLRWYKLYKPLPNGWFMIVFPTLRLMIDGLSQVSHWFSLNIAMPLWDKSAMKCRSMGMGLGNEQPFTSYFFGYLESRRFDMEVSWNRGTSKSSILMGFSLINQPFWGYPQFRKPPYVFTHSHIDNGGFLEFGHLQSWSILDGNFPWNQSTSCWSIPMTMETPIDNILRMFSKPCTSWQIAIIPVFIGFQQSQIGGNMIPLSFTQSWEMAHQGPTAMNVNVAGRAQRWFNPSAMFQGSYIVGMVGDVVAIHSWKRYIYILYIYTYIYIYIYITTYLVCFGYMPQFQETTTKTSQMRHQSSESQIRISDYIPIEYIN